MLIFLFGITYLYLFSYQASQGAKRDLQIQLEEQLQEGRPIKDIVMDIKDLATRNCISEHEIIGIVSSVYKSHVFFFIFLKWIYQDIIV